MITSRRSSLFNYEMLQCYYPFLFKKISCEAEWNDIFLRNESRIGFFFFTFITFSYRFVCNVMETIKKMSGSADCTQLSLENIYYGKRLVV